MIGGLIACSASALPDMLHKRRTHKLTHTQLAGQDRWFEDVCEGTQRVRIKGRRELLCDCYHFHGDGLIRVLRVLRLHDT